MVMNGCVERSDGLAVIAPRGEHGYNDDEISEKISGSRLMIQENK